MYLFGGRGRGYFSLDSPTLPRTRVHFPVHPVGPHRGTFKTPDLPLRVRGSEDGHDTDDDGLTPANSPPPPTPSRLFSLVLHPPSRQEELSLVSPVYWQGRHGCRSSSDTYPVGRRGKGQGWGLVELPTVSGSLHPGPSPWCPETLSGIIVGFGSVTRLSHQGSRPAGLVG